MTGFYDNIKNLQDEKSLRFLYRAPKINLGPLNMNAIKDKYQEVFSLNDNDAGSMSKLMGGYAF